jgi:hypothetical protein
LEIASFAESTDFGNNDKQIMPDDSSREFALNLLSALPEWRVPSRQGHRKSARHMCRVYRPTFKSVLPPHSKILCASAPLQCHLMTSSCPAKILPLMHREPLS